MSHKKTIELEQLKAELHLKQKRIEHLQHVEDKDHSKEVSKNKIDIDYMYMYIHVTGTKYRYCQKRSK